MVSACTLTVENKASNIVIFKCYVKRTALRLFLLLKNNSYVMVAVDFKSN